MKVKLKSCLAFGSQFPRVWSHPDASRCVPGRWRLVARASARCCSSSARPGWRLLMVGSSGWKSADRAGEESSQTASTMMIVVLCFLTSWWSLSDQPATYPSACRFRRLPSTGCVRSCHVDFFGCRWCHLRETDDKLWLCSVTDPGESCKRLPRLAIYHFGNRGR